MAVRKGKKKYKKARVEPISIGWGGEGEIFERKSLGLKKGPKRKWDEVVKVYRKPENVKRVYYAHKVAERLFSGLIVEVTASVLHDRYAMFEPAAKRAEQAPKIYMKFAKQNPELVEYQQHKIRLARMREQLADKGAVKKETARMDGALEKHVTRLRNNPEVLRIADIVYNAGIVFDSEPHNVGIGPGGKIVIFDIYAVDAAKVRSYMVRHDFPRITRRRVERMLKRYKAAVDAEGGFEPRRRK